MLNDIITTVLCVLIVTVGVAYVAYKVREIGQLDALRTASAEETMLAEVLTTPPLASAPSPSPVQGDAAGGPSVSPVASSSASDEPMGAFFVGGATPLPSNPATD